MSNGEKLCTACDLPKPLSEFYFASNHADGLMSRCKTCTSMDAAKWHQNNPEKARDAQIKNYHKDIYKSRALSRARNARWREKIRLEGLAKGLKKD